MVFLIDSVLHVVLKVVPSRRARALDLRKPGFCGARAWEIVAGCSTGLIPPAGNIDGERKMTCAHLLSARFFSSSQS